MIRPNMIKSLVLVMVTLLASPLYAEVKYLSLDSFVRSNLDGEIWLDPFKIPIGVPMDNVWSNLTSDKFKARWSDWTKMERTNSSINLSKGDFNVIMLAFDTYGKFYGIFCRGYQSEFKDKLAVPYSKGRWTLNQNRISEINTTQYRNLYLSTDHKLQLFSMNRFSDLGRVMLSYAAISLYEFERQFIRWSDGFKALEDENKNLLISKGDVLLDVELGKLGAIEVGNKVMPDDLNGYTKVVDKTDEKDNKGKKGKDSKADNKDKDADKNKPVLYTKNNVTITVINDHYQIIQINNYKNQFDCNNLIALESYAKVKNEYIGYFSLSPDVICMTKINKQQITMQIISFNTYCNLIGKTKWNY